MKRIMVVDDDADVRKIIKKALEFFNPDCRVICAESGNKCYEMLKENNIPDLILLDIMMPGMSGWMLVDRIRENPNWRNIAVVFLTGRNDQFAERFGKELGIDFIKKPFDLIDLKIRVEKALKYI